MKAQFALVMMIFSFQFSAQAADITLIAGGPEVNIGGTTVQCTGSGSALPKCYYGSDPSDVCNEVYVMIGQKIVSSFSKGFNTSCVGAHEDALAYYSTLTGSRVCDAGGEVKFTETDWRHGNHLEVVIDGKKVFIR